MRDFFGEEIVRDEAFEASLAKFVKTIEVHERPEYVPTQEDLRQPKKIKIRPSMKPGDWEACLN